MFPLPSHSQPVEIETEEDGSLPLSSVEAHFPGTTTLKYKARVSAGRYSTGPHLPVP